MGEQEQQGTSPVPSEEQIREALRECYDPEIPINIFDLGLIYGIEIQPEGKVQVQMTLTSLGCPIADLLVSQVEYQLMQVPGVKEASVELVWDPPWHPRMATPEGKQQLALLGIPAELLE